ncbi:MAG: hypothetical protein AAF639_43170 [Chloroflexota bacterium]
MLEDIIDNSSNYDDTKERLDVTQFIDHWLIKVFLHFENEYRAAGSVDGVAPGTEAMWR